MTFVDKKELIAKVHSPFGVRGLARVLNFADPCSSISDIKPLQSALGTRFEVEFLFQKGVFSICRIGGIESKEEVCKINGLELFAYRSQLPKLTVENEFYCSSLIGASVILDDGTKVGVVDGVDNFGAGDILLIKDGDSSFYCPFHSNFIKKVNEKDGTLYATDLIIDLKNI